MNFSAVILAGGQSSRMGRDKAWLEIDGETLLSRQIKLVRTIGAPEVFISGRADKDYAEFGCPVLRDKFPGAGPLAGIERALAAIASPLLLVLAVDLAALEAQFLQRLLTACTATRGIVPQVDGQIEPLVAIYPKAAWSLAEKLLSNNENAVATFARNCVQANLAHWLTLPHSAEKFLANWNSPTDLTFDDAPGGDPGA